VAWWQCGIVVRSRVHFLASFLPGDGSEQLIHTYDPSPSSVIHYPTSGNNIRWLKNNPGLVESNGSTPCRLIIPQVSPAVFECLQTKSATDLCSNPLPFALRKTHTIYSTLKHSNAKLLFSSI